MEKSDESKGVVHRRVHRPRRVLIPGHRFFGVEHDVGGPTSVYSSPDVSIGIGRIVRIGVNAQEGRDPNDGLSDMPNPLRVGPE